MKDNTKKQNKKDWITLEFNRTKAFVLLKKNESKLVMPGGPQKMQSRSEQLNLTDKSRSTYTAVWRK